MVGWPQIWIRLTAFGGKVREKLRRGFSDEVSALRVEQDNLQHATERKHVEKAMIFELVLGQVTPDAFGQVPIKNVIKAGCSN